MHYRLILDKDALVESLVPGKVQISMLSTEGVPSEELLNIVRKKLTQDDIRMLTDTITVVSSNIIQVNIHAKVTALSEDTIETAKKQFVEKFESAKRLGWSVTRSWTIANLFVEGVSNIELIEPRENVVVKGDECSCLGNLRIELN
ncbi:MAG: hypothetical protein PG981_001431 [Wolbachia endosymbiont of Ctenocephalides orientis wCori]|nr:MAG: hypothetical protein PG981_001431 [Wolbachia endosymbiont of Ctenocephalides orientis wCori]